MGSSRKNHEQIQIKELPMYKKPKKIVRQSFVIKNRKRVLEKLNILVVHQYKRVFLQFHSGALICFFFLLGREQGG